MRSRVDINADHILELFGELRIVRQLERLDTVRRKLMSLQNALHQPQTDPDRLCKHPAGPMRRRSCGGPLTSSITFRTVSPAAAACREGVSCRAAARRRPPP